MFFPTHLGSNFNVTVDIGQKQRNNEPIGKLHFQYSTQSIRKNHLPTGDISGCIVS